MGLTFRVGNASVAWRESLAQHVTSTLRTRFGEAIELDSTESPYSSRELVWDGWPALQRLAVYDPAETNVSRLLSKETWCEGYFPIETETCLIKFGREQVGIASLPKLVGEMEDIGSALGFPLDENGLKAFSVGCYERRGCGTTERDIAEETYAEFLLTAHVSQERRQIFWVIKRSYTDYQRT